ncbi:MAG: AAA family ATPase [Desulfitobacterium hafniense]|nr:AAA family ATPase [Desulfitobacterium hafniense]
MDNHEQHYHQELEYLKKTLKFIIKELDEQYEDLAEKKEELIASRRDMWENTVPFSTDFERLTELSQFLSGVSDEALNFSISSDRIKKYKQLIDSPYFGRFDFREEALNVKEEIYIGRYTVMDKKTRDVYVYDWRSPIASIYYRYELGEAGYDSPNGRITGEVLLKRQYKIKNSRLEYFFDCNVLITDEILHEILGRNSSPHMKNIVETIQKEQDMIIRDTENEVLIVQGVAGSGKTSIALHRIAFLLYEGLYLGLRSNNIMILSPNDVFIHYISSVLPELGEENVVQKTFDDIALLLLEGRFHPETRASQLERIIGSQDRTESKLRRKSIEFKGSREFRQILDRYLTYYAQNMIPFKDVSFNGILLETKQDLKNRFLDNEVGIPMSKQLKRIEKMLFEKVHPLQKKRLKELEQIVAEMEGHELEIKPYSRLLALKEAKDFREELEQFTVVDFWEMYNILFSEPELLIKLAEGIDLPNNIEEIITTTKHELENGRLSFEDCTPLLYLKLKVEGSRIFSDIKHLVIDEAQDYYPLQYEILKLLFKDANYTILGDINQTIEKNADSSLYEVISKILDKRKTVKLTLPKGYRSTYEINSFNQHLLGIVQEESSFERHGLEPKIEQKNSAQAMDQAIIHDILSYTEQGYETVAVICKTLEEAENVYTRLKNLIKIELIRPDAWKLEKGALVIPAYLAKGLEFDVVLVYGADKEKYSSDSDRKLLYIACTRALHQLAIYYTGEKSPILEKEI